ncbi:MAG: acyl carrier protein [Steroidobacteraceae bacterium]
MTGELRSRDEILERVQVALLELFEIDAVRVTPDANLYRDLEIDSIDAIDLMDRMKRETGLKLAPEDFRAVRTVSDLVDTVHRLVQQS